MLAILDYDAGNIESVRLALLHVGGEPRFVRNASDAAQADRIVFPGVGSAAQCMRNLRQRGFDAVLRRAVEQGIPVLAICIGMQLVFDYSEEDSGVEALGLLPGRVRRFVPPPGDLSKVPHMGWNNTRFLAPHPLLSGQDDDFYFVHSYYVEPSFDRNATRNGKIYGATDYCGVSFASMAGAGSLFAAQFHPEKSGEAGLGILRRFLQWDGRPC